MMGEIRIDVADVRNTMATKSDLATMRQSITAETKAELAAPVDPLKDAVADVRAEVTALKARVTSCESKPASSGALSSAEAVSPDIRKMLDQLDPSKRRVSFIGFPASVGAEARTAEINAYLSQHYPAFKPVSVGNIFRGPYTSRTLSQVAYAEFSDNDIARGFTTTAKAKPISFMSGGSSIAVKLALSSLYPARNYALKRASAVQGKRWRRRTGPLSSVARRRSCRERMSRRVVSWGPSPILHCSRSRGNRAQQLAGQVAGARVPLCHVRRLMISTVFA